MRRSIARGRIVPQSLSTDPRMGRVSLKAALLFPLVWINCDDQGRISGDPDEIKYTTCPNIDHITKTDIPELLKELEKQRFIRVYATSKIMAIQMLDWWEVQRLQWAWPSDYPPPEGWQDRLRYKKGRKEVITENWGDSGENSGDIEHSGEKMKSSRGNLPSPEKENEKERRKRKSKSKIPENSPEFSGEKTTPSLVFLALLENFPKAFGRKPDSREVAYLRDIEKEISAAGATAEQVYDAYKKAAGQNKLHLSYVRAILFDWLGLERGPP